MSSWPGGPSKRWGCLSMGDPRDFGRENGRLTPISQIVCSYVPHKFELICDTPSSRPSTPLPCTADSPARRRRWGSPSPPFPTMCGSWRRPMACSSSPARPPGVALTDMGRKLFAIAERQFEAETRGAGAAVARADAGGRPAHHRGGCRRPHPAGTRALPAEAPEALGAAGDRQLGAAPQAAGGFLDRHRHHRRSGPPGPAFLARKLRSDRLVAVVQRSLPAVEAEGHAPSRSWSSCR